MKNDLIVVDQLTKSYGYQKGIFNLSFTVKEGEVFGFLGPNGAGKTTTIRHLLGFVRPEHGSSKILGMDTQTMQPEIQLNLGYLPGEIAFFDHMTGKGFLLMLADLRELHDLSRMDELITFFELDVTGKIRKMSKGMKQKLGLVAAFMHDPKVLILDEPTSGLDPLMQTKFVDLILQEKKRGKTILMSSHSFEEIERTCDRALIIKFGEMVALEDIQQLKHQQRKIYVVRTKDKKSRTALKRSKFDILNENDLELEIAVEGDINPFLKALALQNIESLDLKAQSLEDIFMHYYKKEDLT